MQKEFNLNVTGYTQIYREPSLWTHNSSIVQIIDDVICYNIDAEGQSGSPIYTPDYKVIGIHQGYSPQRQLNFSLIINNYTIDTLREWCFQIQCSFRDLSVLYNEDYNNYLQKQIPSSEPIQNNTFPQSCIGWLRGTHGYPQIYRTGFLISKCFVLTSAKVVYYIINQQQNYTEIPLKFCIFGSTQQIQVQDYRINPKFLQIQDTKKNLKSIYASNEICTIQQRQQQFRRIDQLQNQLSQHDCALLKIAGQINLSQYFDILPQFDRFKNPIITTIVFEDIYDKQSHLKFSSGKIKSKINRLISYNLEVSEKQAGSPIFSENTRNLVGVHNGFSSHFGTFGTLLNVEVIELLLQWCFQMSPLFDVIDQIN